MNKTPTRVRRERKDTHNKNNKMTQAHTGIKTTTQTEQQPTTPKYTTQNHTKEHQKQHRHYAYAYDNNNNKNQHNHASSKTRTKPTPNRKSPTRNNNKNRAKKHTNTKTQQKHEENRNQPPTNTIRVIPTQRLTKKETPIPNKPWPEPN